MEMMDEKLRSCILKRQDSKISAEFQKETVTIFGCGGLGSNVAMMLARAGVGRLILYDYDAIEYSNLNRQNYTFQEVGASKVFTCKARLENTIPYVQVEAHSQKVTQENLEDICQNSRLFIEAFDDREAKLSLIHISEPTRPY